MQNPNILISGAGIAGTTLAFWLKRHGFNPTLLEVAPALREGGYVIDFFGAGYEVAERMGIVEDLTCADLGIDKVLFVDAQSKRKGSMDYVQLKKMMKGHAFNFLRSDLARVIYNHLDPGVDKIFGDTIQEIEQHENETIVTLRSGIKRSFDLVVGADGLHSNVRNLTFGDEAQFEKYYGYYTASYSMEGSIHQSKSFLMYNVPCRQVALYAYGGTRAAAFFIFASPQKRSFNHRDVNAQKQLLRNEFEQAGWKCEEILSRMDAAPDFYFDVVSQIQMPQWSKGRVTLVGDACDCPSLLSGQGSTLAMVGAYLLAGELKKAQGDYGQAFECYENIFRPFMEGKQKLAQKFAGSLVPKSRMGISMRNTFTRLMALPFLSRWFINQFMKDKLVLENY